MVQASTPPGNSTRVAGPCARIRSDSPWMSLPVGSKTRCWGLSDSGAFIGSAPLREAITDRIAACDDSLSDDRRVVARCEAAKAGTRWAWQTRSPRCTAPRHAAHRLAAGPAVAQHRPGQSPARIHDLEAIRDALHR